MAPARRSIFIHKVMNMLVLSRAQLWSLVQATHRDEIPLSVVQHWFVIYGKDIPKKDVKEPQNEE